MRWLSSLVLVVAGFQAAASDVSINVDRLPVLELVRIYYDSCDKDGFMVVAPGASDAVLTASTPAVSCDAFFDAMRLGLQASGFDIVRREGPDLVVTKVQEHQEAATGPGGAVPVDRAGWETLVYEPRYRAADDLVTLSQFVIEDGGFAHQGGGRFVRGGGESRVSSTGSNGAALRVETLDRIVFYGPRSEVKALQDFWAKVDTPRHAVEIRVAVYEFGRSNAKASALQALTDALRSTVSVDIGSRVAGDSVALNIGDFSAVLSALDQDSRFQYVAQPRIVVAHGEAARFFAGEDVRVTGAVIVDGNGNPVQSREVLSAGVTLEVTPRITADSVSLDIYQGISQFTTASDDPAVLRRDLRTSLPVTPGQVYVLAGLDSDRSSNARQRFLRMPVGRSKDGASTQLVVLLTVEPVSG